MYSHDKKINNLVGYWLGGTLFLVFTTIVVGGLTRLTDSGLSITEWELFKGILPPLNSETWNNYFNSYKEIPHEILNSNMSLQEFKIIFLGIFSPCARKLLGFFFFYL